MAIVTEKLESENMKNQQLQFKIDQQEKELIDLRYSKSDFKMYNDSLVDKCE